MPSIIASGRADPARRVDEPHRTLAIHGIPRVAVDLEVAADDAAVGDLQVLGDRV